jgi:nitroimidazol reductase NimA-like FMN-containing flavoprotein (pyridoxamine 5'-phosphate oxidase superfamily)
MPVDRNGLEILSREECLHLLAHAHVGRIALSVRALPVVLPVNFAVLDDDIVMRSGPGTKLDAALDNAVVAFEVDSFQPLDHTGWSVMVQGIASEITDDLRLARAMALPLRPWAGERMNRYIRIATHEISGRRLSHVHAASTPLVAIRREEP